MMLEKLKITYVTMQWPAPTETFAARDVLAAKKLGAEIDVLALRPRHQRYEQLIQEQGISSVPSESAEILQFLSGALLILLHPLLFAKIIFNIFVTEHRPVMLGKAILLLPAAFWAWGKIQKNPPQVVHLFWGHFPAMVGFLVQRTMPHLPVTTFLGAYDLEYAFGLSRLVANRSGGVFTHSKSNVSQIASLGITAVPIYVIWRGLPTESYEEHFLQANTSKRVPGKILFVGRFSREKGVFAAAEAVALLRKKYPEAHLLLCGAGEAQDQLSKSVIEKEYGDFIKILGWQSPSEIIKYLVEAEIFLLPSESASERLPNAVKEAMLLGAVPVTSPSQGIDELVAHGKDGYIVSQNNTQEIANAMATLLSNKDLQSQMRKAGHEKILQQFSATNSMKKYLEVWRGFVRT